MIKAMYQPSLFNQGPFLDPVKADQEAAAGIVRSMDTADDVATMWRQKAYDHLLAFLATRSTEFMAEDIRKFAAHRGLIKPPTEKAWGGIMARARAEKLIRKVAIRSTSSKSAHGNFATVWIKE